MCASLYYPKRYSMSDKNMRLSELENWVTEIQHFFVFVIDNQEAKEI